MVLLYSSFLIGNRVRIEAPLFLDSLFLLPLEDCLPKDVRNIRVRFVLQLSSTAAGPNSSEETLYCTKACSSRFQPFLLRRECSQFYHLKETIEGILTGLSLISIQSITSKYFPKIFRLVVKRSIFRQTKLQRVILIR